MTMTARATNDPELFDLISEYGDTIARNVLNRCACCDETLPVADGMTLDNRRSWVPVYNYDRANGWYLIHESGHC